MPHPPTRVRPWRTLTCLAVLCLAHPALAQQSTPPPRQAQIKSVNPQTVHAGGRITLTFDTLSLISTKAEDLRKLVLYLDGFALDSVNPEAIGRNSLRFELHRPAGSSQAAWGHLLSRAGSRGHSFTVGVGQPGQREISRNDGTPAVALKLVAYNSNEFQAGIVAIIIIALAFAGVAVKTGMLRDRGAGNVATLERPYSLARVQIAVWFFVIFGSALYIFLVMHELVLTAQAAVLLGLGTATAVGADIVEHTKPEVVFTGKKHRNPLVDLLTDDTGVSFHRFQMLVWTLALAAFFAWTVIDKLTMPEFSTAILGLMGISGGTYLSLKLSEQQTSAADTTRTGTDTTGTGTGTTTGTAGTATQDATGTTGTGQISLGAGAKIVGEAKWESDTMIVITAKGAKFATGITVEVNGKAASKVEVKDAENLEVTVAEQDEVHRGDVVNLTVRNPDGPPLDVQLA